MLIQHNDQVCNLQGLSNLDIYIWTEGFGANIATTMARQIERLSNSTQDGNFIPNITGLILGDPIVSYIYQYNNFGSFAIARGLVDQVNLEKISSVETSFLLMEHTNDQICQIHERLYMIIRPACPVDVTTTCPEIYNKLDSKALFPLLKGEDELSNNFQNFLKNELKVIRYVYNMSKFMDTIGLKITSIESASMLANNADVRKVMVYQTQNNFVSNSISSLLFIDNLRWDFYTQFLRSSSNSSIVQISDAEKTLLDNRTLSAISYTDKQNKTILRDFWFRTTVKRYDNLCKIQVYNFGGDVMDRVPRLMSEYVFKKMVAFPRNEYKRPKKSVD